MSTIVLKAVYVAVGALLMLNGAVASVLSSWGAGTAATLAVGLCALLYGVLLDRALTLPVAINAAFLVLVAVGFGFCVGLLAYGTADSVTYDEDAVIVLGCGIKGERIGASLEERLDTAVAYHKRNSTALIVVSGGRGKREDITEAEAMRRYLVSKGVPERLIIKEERSTSTAENFSYSKRLLDEHFRAEEYGVAYITNNYHIYRAGVAARSAGLSPTHLGAKTPWYLVIPSTFRECMATVKYWLS